MGLPLFPILKALPTIISSASGIIASINARKDSASGMRGEERVRKLEDDVLNAGKVLSGLAQQVQAMAQEVKDQAELNAAREKRITTLFWISIGALALSCGACVVALAR